MSLILIDIGEISIISIIHMVFHLPNQNALRSKINYTQEFALTLLWNVGIAGMIITSLFIVFYILKKYQLRVAKNEAIRESILTQQDRSSNRVTSRTQSEELKIQQKMLNVTPKTKLFKAINIITSIFFYLFWVIATIIYLVFYMFGYFGRGVHIDVFSVFLLTIGVLIPTLLWKHKTKIRDWDKQKGQTVFTIILLVIWLAVSVFLVIATKGACVCYYNDQYGFKVAKDAKFSSQWTRSLQLKPPCPQSDICHLYATVPQDASTSVFFNVHSGVNLEKITFTLKYQNKTIGEKSNLSPLKMDNVESMGQRYVHSVLFTGLVPNQIYNLQIADKSGNILKQTNYKTLPGLDASSLKIAVGGDLGMTKQGVQMTSYLSNFEPDAIMLGGDTTYDDGMRSCYYSWDQFYGMFEPLYEKLDRIVPLILSVGNHDVGFDALTENQISTEPDDIPLFFYFNPQHFSEQKDKDIPDLAQRKSYHFHKLGPIINFNLDSGYVTPYSDQAKFIRDNSAKNSNFYKFANYHNPIYPSCTNSASGSNDRQVIEHGLQNWTPLFDQFGFVASMEHHTHYRKFTYKLKNNTISNSDGTRYIGDGSWGVTENMCSNQDYTPYPQLIEAFANQQSNHIWQITLQKPESISKYYKINYTAINLQGRVVIQKIEDLPSIL